MGKIVKIGLKILLGIFNLILLSHIILNQKAFDSKELLEKVLSSSSLCHFKPDFSILYVVIVHCLFVLFYLHTLYYPGLNHCIVFRS
jgi:hypothetical protein